MAANVNINLLYSELKRMRSELHELRSIFISEEKISAAERKELRSILANMRKGKEKNWRENIKG